MKYRPEIDGLRALAVIPVIFFHAGLPSFRGGFIGVDVFFVISGYLITTIILSELRSGSFSLARFYERRARRILPALFLVMLVSLPFAWFILLPHDMKSFSQSLIAVSTFTSNILFMFQSGYWDITSELRPLLHTWSLAIEEQFYILFPLFLIIMWRTWRSFIPFTFIVIIAASLCLAQLGAYYKPGPTFYLLPTRAWELSIGAILAYYLLYIRRNNAEGFLGKKVLTEVMPLAGLVLLGYSIATFNKNTPFPSFFTLIPTMGTALIILYASSDTIAGRLLSFKPLVGVGLISYSAYLWHQPILAFTRHKAINDPAVSICAILALLSFPLAWLSWRFVERPFRSKSFLARKQIMALAVAGSSFFVVVGITGHMTDGFDVRYSKSNLTVEKFNQKLEASHGLNKACDKTFKLVPECRTSDEPEILVWGDSYAMHLIPGILASKPDAGIIQMTKSVCGPFFDVAPISSNPKYSESWAHGCLEFTKEVRKWLTQNKTVKYAVLSSPFIRYLSPSQQLLFRDGTITATSTQSVVQEFRRTLYDLIELGVTPVIFTPPPRPSSGIDLGRCLARAKWLGIDLDECNFDVQNLSHSTAVVYDFLNNFKKEFKVIALDEMICNDQQCITHFEDTFIYRDTSHFSQEGSAFLGKKFNFYNMISGK